MAIRSDELPVVDPLEISGLRDPIGVVSVYVDADPKEQAAARPAWVVATENGLRDVRERVKVNGDHARWKAVFERLDELEPELSALLDPRRPGRGRALFATVEGGELRTVALHVPLRNHVALDEIVHLSPLVAALDRGRPVGIVVATQADVRVLERRLGLVEELVTVSLEPDTSEWRELKGPAAANPALAQHAASQRDLFERRLEEHRLRALDDAARRLAELAGKRGWERALAAGERRAADRLAEALGGSRLEISVVDKNVHGLAPTDVVAALASELEDEVRRREERLVARALDAALSGNAGALGLADVLAALEEGRVAHLLLSEGGTGEGARTADGRLVPAGVVPPGVDPGELVPISALAEHLVQRALATDAQVTVVSAPSAEPLLAHGGVAALLRW
ncbi:MAG: hypothetical protein KatS3mg012_1828 [Gaiellaceae bacterium]|jgi:hypothetical protein|nr:MAG: hypothetical protein KatS3mg012_1828 [Gaiellaceae bacterium]